MITDAKEWAEDREREMKENYEKRKEEDASFYREMDDDQLLEVLARKLPGCSSKMCFACLDTEVLIDEIRRRMEEK